MRTIRPFIWRKHEAEIRGTAAGQPIEFDQGPDFPLYAGIAALNCPRLNPVAGVRYVIGECPQARYDAGVDDD